MSVDLKNNESLEKETKFPINGSRVVFTAEESDNKKKITVKWNCPDNNKFELVRKNHSNGGNREYQFKVKGCDKNCKEEITVNIKKEKPTNIWIWTKLPENKPEDIITDRGTVVKVQRSGKDELS